jgi:MFS family permease
MLSKTFNSYKQAFTGLSKETWLLSWIMLVNRSGTMVVPFLSLYLTSPAMGYSLSQAGFVFGLFGAGAFAGAFIGGRLTDKIGFYKIQLITLLGGGLLFMILGQMKSYPLICIFTFVLSFVNEAFRPANSTAIAFYSNEASRTRSYSFDTEEADEEADKVGYINILNFALSALIGFVVRCDPCQRFCTVLNKDLSLRNKIGIMAPSRMPDHVVSGMQ